LLFHLSHSRAAAQKLALYQSNNYQEEILWRIDCWCIYGAIADHFAIAETQESYIYYPVTVPALCPSSTTVRSLESKNVSAVTAHNDWYSKMARISSFPKPQAVGLERLHVNRGRILHAHESATSGPAKEKMAFLRISNSHCKMEIRVTSSFSSGDIAS